MSQPICVCTIIQLSHLLLWMSCPAPSLERELLSLPSGHCSSQLPHLIITLSLSTVSILSIYKHVIIFTIFLKTLLLALFPFYLLSPSSPFILTWTLSSQTYPHRSSEVTLRSPNSSIAKCNGQSSVHITVNPSLLPDFTWLLRHH